MKLILLLTSLLATNLVHASSMQIVSCNIMDNTFTEVKINFDAKVGDQLARLRVNIDGLPNEKEDTFYPRIYARDLKAAGLDQKLTLIADVSSKREYKPHYKRIVIDIDGNTGTFYGLLEGDKSERASVQKRAGLSCTWNNL